MTNQFQRTVMMGAYVVIAVNVAACMSPPGEVCGDLWCPAETVCVQDQPDPSTLRETCIDLRLHAPDVVGFADPKYLISGMSEILAGDAMLRILFETRTSGTNVALCAGTMDDAVRGQCSMYVSGSGGPGFRFLTVIDPAVLSGKVLYAIREVGDVPAQFALTIDAGGQSGLRIDYTGVADPEYVISGIPAITSGDTTLRMLFENKTPGADVALCAGTIDDFVQGDCSMQLSISNVPGVRLLAMIDARMLSGKVLYAIRETGTGPAQFALTID